MDDTVDKKEFSSSEENNDYNSSEKGNYNKEEKSNNNEDKGDLKPKRDADGARGRIDSRDGGDRPPRRDFGGGGGRPPRRDFGGGNRPPTSGSDNGFGVHFDKMEERIYSFEQLLIRKSNLHFRWLLSVIVLGFVLIYLSNCSYFNSLFA